MASKWKNSYDEGRKYQTCWEQTFLWCRKASDGTENAFCKLCTTPIEPKSASLSRHEKTKKHVRIVEGANLASVLPFRKISKVSDEVKKFEIEMSVAMACHGSIRAIDHLGEVMKRGGNDTVVIGKTKLHRTKCSKLLTKVVAPSIEKELKEDIKGKKFAILMDEATDISSEKNMAFLLRFYSEKEDDIVTRFAGLVPLVYTTGEDLFNALKIKLAEIGISLQNSVGFGSDGEAKMVGVHNGLWSKIREEAPNCVLVRCICHSLALCVQHAFKKVPSNIGFMLSEIPNWFSKSTIRRNEFISLFNIMNPEKERQGTPTPFYQFAQTRWLCRGKVISSILANWEELKAYFSGAEAMSDQNCKYKARLILEMLNDHVNYLYFTFLAPIVTEFERVNSFFQATNADPNEMEKELDLFHKSLKSRMYSGTAIKPLDDVQLGAKFRLEIEKFRNSRYHTGQEERSRCVKERCRTFLSEALIQVEKRLPDSRGAFKGLNLLHPDKILSVSPPNLEQLPFSHLREVNCEEIDEQYRRMQHVKWTEENVFQSVVPQDTVKFWSGIRKYQDFRGNNSFKEVADYALSCLVLPVSNAVVERTFSYVTAVKTKQRNRMGNTLLNAIISIRTGLFFQRKCCREFEVTKSMIESFNTFEMYANTEETEQDIDEINALDDINDELL